VHAIDRSPVMIAAARRRNAAAVAAGLATFATTTIQDADLPDAAFDGVLALRVRELWTDAATVLPRIARWLQPDGRLCAVLDAPRPGGAEPAVRQLVDRLVAHGFRDARADPAVTADVVAVTARPSG
jgi:SAM-dependent methyltransferase